MIPPRFSYVFIPASGKPEERVHEQVSLEEDKFIAMVKAHFAASESLVSSDILRQQISANNPVTSDVMDTLLASGVSLDIFGLSMPIAASAFLGVSLYCDDKGIAKSLPHNSVANALANSCGVKNQSFRGDVFISRVFDDNESDWFRSDFTIADLADNASWQIQARELNAKKPPVSLSSLTQNFAEAQAKKDASGCEWVDEGESVEVRVLVGKVARKDVDVTIKVDKILVKVGGKGVFETSLHAKISPTDSSWIISDDKVILSLEKSNAGASWPSLGSS